MKRDLTLLVTVAPQSVGFAGDGTFWTAAAVNDAIDASLAGGFGIDSARRVT